MTQANKSTVIVMPVGSFCDGDVALQRGRPATILASLASDLVFFWDFQPEPQILNSADFRDQSSFTTLALSCMNLFSPLQLSKVVKVYSQSLSKDFGYLEAFCH